MGSLERPNPAGQRPLDLTASGSMKRSVRSRFTPQSTRTVNYILFLWLYKSADCQTITVSEQLLHNRHYHLYNRSNGQVSLFKGEADYQRFLRLYQKYIPSIADTLAWVLMGNHFHLVVRIKSPRVYKYSRINFPSNADRAPLSGDAIRFEDVKWETIPAGNSPTSIGDRSASEGPDRINEFQHKPANPAKHFSHLFNAYTKYFNLRHHRTGNFFQRQFKRNPIESDTDLRQAIIYTHQNPVMHEFVKSPQEYPWTSYHQYADPKLSDEVIRSALLKHFDNRENFIAVHQMISGFAGFDL